MDILKFMGWLLVIIALLSHFYSPEYAESVISGFFGTIIDLAAASFFILIRIVMMIVAKILAIILSLGSSAKFLILLGLGIWIFRKVNK